MFHVEQIELLKSVLEKNGYTIPQDAIHLFSVFQKSLLDYNRHVNLISRSDENRIVTRHFLQSIGLLKIVNFPAGSTVLDLGSGAGFPGIPLKIMRPDLSFVFAEAVVKKANFIQHAVQELNLDYVRIWNKRLDEFHVLKEPVEFTVVRSVSTLVKLMRWSYPSMKSGGKIIAIKNLDIYDELEQAKAQKALSKFKTAKYELFPYDPFPELFSLEKSVVLVAEKQ
jgi:16S rRNA (guanine527-N7)-methyltransferase